MLRNVFILKFYFFCCLEPECGTDDKLLLLACEDGQMRCYDVHNRNNVRVTFQVVITIDHYFTLETGRKFDGYIHLKR